MSYKSKSYQKFLGTSVSATVVASALIPGAVPAVQAAETSFSDVKSNDYFSAAVKDLSDRNIIKGYEDGTFRPYQTVTRAQAAKMLALTLGLELSNVKNPGFTDVKTSDWYYGPVAALVSAGIIKGYDDKTFRPNETLTRAQMAKIIALGFDLGETSDNKFSDVKKDDWFAGYVGSLIEKDITTGTTPTTFSPNKNITRGQMAAFIYRTEQAKKPVAKKQKIENIEESQITIAGISYKVEEGVKPLLHVGNKTALKDALISFEETNGTITKVTSLELSASANSTKEKVIFDGQNGTIDGDLTVNGDYIVIENVKVKGNLTIGQNVKNSFDSSNLVVEGKTFVSTENVKQAVQSEQTTFSKALAYKKTAAASTTANTSAKFTFDNTVLGTVEVSRENIEVSLTGKTTVKEIVISKETSLSASSTISIPTLIVKEGVKAVELAGSISQLKLETENEVKLSGKVKIKDLTITNKNGKIELGKEAEVVNIDLPEGTKVKDIIKNYNDVKGNIDKVDGKATSTNSSGSSSSSGGGSSLKSAPVLSADTTDVELGQNIELTFTENEAWRGKIEKVSIEGHVVDTSKYTIADGKITLDSSLFASAQSYDIVVEADGYRDATVTQLITAASTGIPSTISQPGTYGSSDEKQTIQETLTVTSRDVTLKNLVIEGDLVLAEGIGDGEVYLDGVEVKGKTIVKGGGVNSIYFKDSVLVTVIVNKNDGRIRIVAQGDTKVVDLQLESYVEVEEQDLTNNAPGFTNVTLTAGIQNVSQDLQIQLEGEFETVNSRARNVRITLPEGISNSIEQLVVSAVGAIVSGGGKVGTAQINAENVRLSQLPDNLVLEIPNSPNGIGSVNIGGVVHEGSYSAEREAAITDIKATQGMIDLTFDKFVSDLTIDDFEITASINGQTVDLGEMTYKPTQRKIFYTPILDESNLGEELEITVAPKEGSLKVTGEAKTVNVPLQTGFEGRITDIFGVGVSNVEIHFRRGMNNQEGEPVEVAKTDQYGYYSVTLPPGDYTGEIVGESFITSYIYAVAPSNGYNTNQNETAIYAAASSELKIALSWGDVPYDVDSHLVGPKPNGEGTFHTWYGSEIYENDNIIYADLDWDDTESYGPETTTIRQLTDGKYTFVVHNFSESPALRTSNAKVEVFRGNSKEADHVFQIPTGDGEELYWTVFELEISNDGQNIEIREINELTEERPEFLPEDDWAPEEYTLEDLQFLVEDAQSVYEETVEGTEAGEYREGARNVLLQVITETESVLEAGGLTDDQIQNAYQTLDDALEAFENERFIEVSEEYDYGLNWVIKYAEFLLNHEADQFEQELLNDLTTNVEAASALLGREIITFGELRAVQEQLEVLIEETMSVVPSQVVRLNLAIGEAEELIANAVEGSNPGQYPQGSIDALQTAVNEARLFLSEEEATEDEWWQALEVLHNAIFNFNESEIREESSVDVSGLENLISIAEDALDGAVVGNDVGQYPQEFIEALQSAVNAANATLVTENLTASDVSQAEQLLQEVLGTTGKYRGVVTDVRRTVDAELALLEIMVDGVEYEYVLSEPTDIDVTEGQLIEVEAEYATGKIPDRENSIRVLNQEEQGVFHRKVDENFQISLSQREIIFGDEIYKLANEGYVYDITDLDDIQVERLADLGDLEAGVDITLLLDEENPGLVKYVLFDKEPSTQEPADGQDSTETEEVLDMGDLQELIDKAQTILDEHANYDFPTKGSLQTKVNEANNLLQTTAISQEDLVAAVDSLMRAIELANLDFVVETANDLLENPEGAVNTVELEALREALQETQTINDETPLEVLSGSVNQLITAIIAVQSIIRADQTESLIDMNEVYSGEQTSQAKWAWFERLEPHLIMDESAGFEGELSLKGLAFSEEQDQLKFTWSASESFIDGEGVLELRDNNGTVGVQEDDILIKELHFQTVTQNGNTVVEFIDLIDTQQ